MYASSVSQTFLIDEDFCDFSLDFFLSSTFLGSNSFFCYNLILFKKNDDTKTKKVLNLFTNGIRQYIVR